MFLKQKRLEILLKFKVRTFIKMIRYNDFILLRLLILQRAPLIDVIHNMSSPSQCISTDKPQSFEQLGQGYGFILYQTKLKNLDVYGKKLSIIGIHDRGYILIGKTPIGILHRDLDTELTIKLKNNTEYTLYIIVENMGRLNFGDDLLDTKVILLLCYQFNFISLR